jgi:hypothetical protein
MLESSFFQVQKDIAVKALHRLLTRQGTQKFGPPGSSITAALEAINDLARLERICERIFDATSWDDLMATP